MKRAIQIFISLVSLISSGALLLAALLGAPSFWWFVATAMLVVAALSGLFSAAAYTGLSVPALTAITIAAVPLDLWHESDVRFVLLPFACLWIGLIASFYISRGLRKTTLFRASAISCLVVASGFGVDRAFTNRVKVHSYEMLWATGSDGPVEGAAENKGETRLVIYRSDSGSVCYDAIYSNELVRYVNGLQKPLVHVEYEVFYDFGKARGYNVRSIEGKLITKCAHPVLRDAGSQGGYIGYPNSSGECNR